MLDIPDQLEPYVVYELSIVDRGFYVGRTCRLRRRVSEHKSDKNISSVRILFSSVSEEVCKMAEAIYIDAGWSNNINKATEKKYLKMAQAHLALIEDGLIEEEEEEEEEEELDEEEVYITSKHPMLDELLADSLSLFELDDDEEAHTKRDLKLRAIYLL